MMIDLGSRFLVSVRVPQSGVEVRGGLAKPEPGRLNQCCTNEEMMTDVAEGIPIALAFIPVAKWELTAHAWWTEPAASCGQQ